MYVNEQVVLQNIEDVVQNYAIRFGVSMRVSEDRLMRDMLAASASSVMCTGGGNGDFPTNIAESDISEVTTALSSADALTPLDSIEGEDRYGTSPISNSYFGLSNTMIQKDLLALGYPTFVKTIQYASQTNILRSEFGTVGQVRFMVSSQGSITPLGSRQGRTVMNNFITGIESIGCVYMDDMASEFVYLPKEYSGGLAQNITLGMKFFEAPAIFQDLWICNLKSTPSR